MQETEGHKHNRFECTRTQEPNETILTARHGEARHRVLVWHPAAWLQFVLSLLFSGLLSACWEYPLRTLAGPSGRANAWGKRDGPRGEKWAALDERRRRRRRCAR